MSHKFYCPKCGGEIADCGMPDDHSKTFSFSTTCKCGTLVSGSCGRGSKKIDLEPKQKE